MNRALVLALAACGGRSSTPAGSQVGPALTAALTAADRTLAPWRCSAVDGPHAPDDTITVGAHAWKQSGHTLTRADDKASEIVIGAIADAGGSAPSTLAALGRIRGTLSRADVVLVLGGLGTTQAELEATLGLLGDKAPFPIVVLPGDLESIPALTKAIAALRSRGIPVIDGRLVQQLEAPGVAIAMIAGTSARGRLVSGDDGCTYREADAEAALAALSSKPGVRVLASVEAPRSQRAGDATGELPLTAGATHEIDIALHGPTGPGATRARSGARDGDAVELSPGTIDAMPRLPGPATAPTAGLLTISGTAWSWKPVAVSE